MINNIIGNVKTVIWAIFAFTLATLLTMFQPMPPEVVQNTAQVLTQVTIEFMKMQYTTDAGQITEFNSETGYATLANGMTGVIVNGQLADETDISREEVIGILSNFNEE